MKSVKVTVLSQSGLHARPAGLLVGLVKSFVSEIAIEKDGRKINAKSIMGILSLGTSHGDVLTVYADGSDEDEAIQGIEVLFHTKLASE